MPVRFEQPDPYDANAAYSAARAAEDRRRVEADRDYNLRVSGQAAQERAGQLRAGVDLATAAAATDQQTQERAFRQRQFEEAQRPSERDLFAQQARMAEARQAAELSAWVNSRQITEAEMARYQRLDNQVGQVLAAEDLTKAEKREWITAIRTGIDPLERRVQESRQKQIEALAQQETENARRMAAATAAAGKLDAMTFEERTRWVVPPDVRAEVEPQVRAELMADPQFAQLPPQVRAQHAEQKLLERAAATGRALFYYQDKPGSWSQQEYSGQKKQAAEKDAFAVTPQTYFDVRDKIARQVDQRILNGSLQPDQRSRAIADELTGHGLPLDVNQLRGWKGQPVGAVPTGDEGGPAPVPVRFQPFDPRVPDTVRTPEQRAVVQVAGEDGVRIDRSAAPESLKQEARAANHKRMVLVAQAGGDLRMATGEEFRRLTAVVNAAIDFRPPPGSAPAARPPSLPPERWSPSAKFQ